MIGFLIPFVLFQISAQVCSLGSLVYASMYTGGLSGPALMALVQAVANAGALLVAQKLSFKNAPRIILYCAAIFSVINGAVTFLIGDINSVTLFLRLLSGALLTGLLLSHGPRILSSDIKKSNQVLQTWASISALIGFGIAPILASSVTLLFSVDVILNGFSFILFAATAHGFGFEKFCAQQEESKTPTQVNSFFSQLDAPVFYLAFITFILWCFGGFFHVIEVPLLIQRFGLSNSQVSLIFVLTLILNISSVALLNRRFVAKYAWFILVISTFMLGLACLVYLKTSSLLIVTLVVVLIGAANGAFNLSQTTVLQNIESHSARLSSFIFVRLLAQVGLMLGALLAGSGVIISTSQLSEKLSFSKSNGKASINEIRVLVQNLPQHIEPYKNSDTGSMLVVHQIFDNLFEYDSRNNLVPKLIESLVWQNKNMSLLLTVKKGVTFSNGDLLVAQDIEKSLLEAKVQMGESGDWAFGQLKSIQVRGPLQLELTFRKPFTLMPAILASPYFGIFKRDKSGALLGTGEYVLDSRAAHQITLRKNSKNTFYLQEAPELVYLVDQYDPKMQLTLSDDKIDNMIAIDFRTLQTVLFVPNLRDPLLSSKPFRCQLISELSRTARQVYSKWKPTDLGLPFSSDLFPVSADAHSAADLAQSKNPVQIHYSNSAAKFEELSNTQMSKNLTEKGFKVEFRQLPIRDLVARAKKGEFSGLMFGYVPDFVHPHALIAPLLETRQTFNFGNYSNREVDRLLNLALGEPDRLKQSQLYAQGLRLIQADCGIGFLGSQTGTLYLDPQFEPPEVGQLGLHNMRLSLLKRKAGN